MKKQNLILSVFFLTVLLGISACGDDEVSKASKEEVQAAFQAANDQVSTGTDDFSSSSGYKAMNQLSALTDGDLPFGRKPAKKREQVIENLKVGVYAIRGILKTSTSSGRTNDDEPFDFDENKGIYEWDSENEEFDRTGDSDIIEIWFPTVEGSSTNDAEFRMTEYAEITTPDGDELYSPTVIKASILVDDVKELEVDAEVEYGAGDEPVKGDIYYFVNPFALEISFDDTKSKSSSFSETLSKSGRVLIGFGATVNFQDATKDEETITSISGFVQLVDVKLIVSAKAPQSSSGSEDINDFVTITIKVRNKVGGKILLEEDENSSGDFPYTPIVKYNDGSTEPLENLLGDISFDIEDVLK